MKFAPVPLTEREGKILGHNIVGADGQRLLRKGKPLTSTDIQLVLSRTEVQAAFACCHC